MKRLLSLSLTAVLVQLCGCATPPRALAPISVQSQSKQLARASREFNRKLTEIELLSDEVLMYVDSSPGTNPPMPSAVTRLRDAKAAVDSDAALIEALVRATSELERVNRRLDSVVQPVIREQTSQQAPGTRR